MANYLQLGAYRDLQFGPLVAKTAVANGITAAVGLYTVGTGNVLVTSLNGVVTTAAATAGTMTIGVTSANSTVATALALATTVATTFKAGTCLAVQPAALATTGNTATTSAMAVGTAGVVGTNSIGAVIPSGGVITATTSSNMGGNISWYLTYVPLDAGANVT